MAWSSVSIAGRPTVLVVDASRNLEGWEAEFCDRLYSSMKRRGIGLKGNSPVQTERPEDLIPHLEPQDSFNCVLLFSHGDEDSAPTGTSLRSYWSWISSHAGLAPKLFAVCTWESYDPLVSQEILESSDSFAPLALAPQSPLTPRDAGLFLLKFFTELELHSSDAITGRMVWFSCSKARELLRRRRLTGKFGMRT